MSILEGPLGPALTNLGFLRMDPVVKRFVTNETRKAVADGANLALLSTFGVIGTGDELSKLRNALDYAVANALTLVIDRSIMVTQTATTHALFLPTNQRVEFTNGASITQTTFGLPVFYSAGTSGVTLVNPKILFGGAIPAAVPAVTTSFKAAVQALISGISVVPVSEFACGIGLWQTDNALVYRPWMGSASNVPLECMNICIDTWNTTNTTIQDAYFDGYVMGVLGSRNKNLQVFARSGRRTNVTESRAWSAPGHVVYISPTGSSERTQEGRIIVLEGDKMLVDTDNSSTASVKINDADDLDVYVKSRFPRGGLTVDGLTNSRVVMHHSPGVVTYPSGCAPVRFLATTNPSANNTFDLTIEIPDGFANYIEIGQAIASVANLISSEVRLKFTHLGTNITLGSELFRLSGFGCTVKMHGYFPNATAGTLTLLNAWSTGQGNDVEITYAMPKYSSYAPIVRADDGMTTLRSLNTLTGEKYELQGGAIRHTKILTATLTPGAGATSVTVPAFVPRGYRVVSLASKITTALSGTSGYNLGDGSVAARFGTRASTGVGGSTNNASWTTAGSGVELSDMTLALSALTGNFDGLGSVKVTAEVVSNF